MYIKQLSKFEKGKKLEIAVCNVQKIEKNTKKPHAIVNNTEIFKNLLKKICHNGIMGSYQKKNSLTRF